MGLTANSVVYAQDFRDISSTKELPLGTKGFTRDGRIYRYALAGGVTLAPGKLCIDGDLVAHHTNIAVDANVAAGVTKVTATIGATAVTADQYKDGYLVVNDATGEGINYLIDGHSANAGSLPLEVRLVDPIEVALVASTSEITLKANPWSGVLISIADQADQAVGVPNVSITNAYYGWLQTGGECAVLADEAVAKGLALTIGSSTVGAVEALDAAGEHQIGVASEALVDTEYRSAYLTIDQ
jgi:hypothetical protein